MSEQVTPTWMPLDVGDYLRDTQHLSAIEHGAYLLLLMHAWTNGGDLPADEKRLARIARLTPKEWKNSRFELLEFFTLSGQVYRQKRIDEELHRADLLIEKKRAAGRASAQARANRRSTGEPTGVGTGVPTRGSTQPPTEGQHNSNQVQVQGSVTDVTGGEPPSEDPIKALFDLGIVTLKGAGYDERQARSMVGRWRKAHGDAAIVEALMTAADKSDPVSWVQARLNGRSREQDALFASIDRKYAGAGGS